MNRRSFYVLQIQGSFLFGKHPRKYFSVHLTNDPIIWKEYNTIQISSIRSSVNKDRPFHRCQSHTCVRSAGLCVYENVSIPFGRDLPSLICQISFRIPDLFPLRFLTSHSSVSLHSENDFLFQCISVSLPRYT